eukprot:9034087-Alexandrium_andersonii.AAC.1
MAHKQQLAAPKPKAAHAVLPPWRLPRQAAGPLVVGRPGREVPPPPRAVLPPGAAPFMGTPRPPLTLPPLELCCSLRSRLSRPM